MSCLFGPSRLFVFTELTESCSDLLTNHEEKGIWQIIIYLVRIIITIKLIAFYSDDFRHNCTYCSQIVAIWPAPKAVKPYPPLLPNLKDCVFLRLAGGFKLALITLLFSSTRENSAANLVELTTRCINLHWHPPPYFVKRKRILWRIL